MFNIVDYPPGLGECSFCKKHTCGTKEDGTQLWLHSPIELHVGNDLTIGYQCAKMIMDGFGLTVEVREKEVLLTPTDEQIGEYVRKAVNVYGPSPILPMIESQISDNRESLKKILDEKGVKYFKGASDEVLAELVAKNE